MVQQFFTRFALLLLLSINGGIYQNANHSFTVATNNVHIAFPTAINFSLAATTNDEFSKIVLFYGTTSQSCLSSSVEQNIEFTPGSEVEINWEWELEDQIYLPPGVNVWWYWELTDTKGNEFSTPTKEIVISDNRYDWNNLQDGKISVSWINGSFLFGQSLLDIAKDSLLRLESQAGLQFENNVKLYIYPETSYFVPDMDTMPDWTGGVAFSNYDVILIGIAPDIDQEWANEVIPHEVAHLVTNTKTFNCKGISIPLWLNEGISVFNEGPTPKKDYDQVQTALANNTLPKLISMKSSFSVNATRAHLAYSFSGQVVGYLIDEYGNAKLQDLLYLVSNGTQFDEALIQTYGLTTSELDYAFRSSRGFTPTDWQFESESDAPKATSTPIPTIALYNPSNYGATETQEPTITITPIPTRNITPTISKQKTDTLVQTTPDNVEIQSKSRNLIPILLSISIGILLLTAIIILLKKK